jgi:hypothetical protein
LVYAALALIPFFDANSRALMDYAEEIDQLMRKVPCARKLYIGEKKKKSAGSVLRLRRRNNICSPSHRRNTRFWPAAHFGVHQQDKFLYMYESKWMNGPAT